MNLFITLVENVNKSHNQCRYSSFKINLEKKTKKKKTNPRALHKKIIDKDLD
jgi:hypothetical protein